MSSLNVFVFVKLIAHLALYDAPTVSYFLVEWLAVDPVTWEENFDKDHTNARDNVLSEDYFFDEETLELCLWGLFRAIDTSHKKSITYGDFSAFVIDGALRGSNTEKEIKPYSLLRDFPTGLLYRLSHLVYVEESQEYMALVMHKDGNLRHGVHPGELRYVHARTFKVTGRLRWTRNYGAMTSFCAIVKKMDRGELKRFTVATFSDGGCRVFGKCNDGDWQIRMEWSLQNKTQTLCIFEPSLNTLLLGSRFGELSLWDISEAETIVMYRSDKPIKPKTLRSRKVHDAAITGLIVLPLGYYLLTCSMDCTVNMLVLKNLTIHRTFTGHKQGITQMALHRQFGLLVTISVEYAPRVWTVNVPNAQGVEMNDFSKPHLCEIIRVYVVPGTPECITFDAEGVFKVWDLQNLTCSQTFLADEHVTREEKRQFKFKAFAYNVNQHQIVTSFRRQVYVFEYNLAEKGLDPLHSHCYPMVGFFYMEAQRVFLTVSRHDISMWDSITGQLLRVESDYFTVEIISTFCVDATGSILYIGTESGSIWIFNMSNMMRIGNPFRNLERSELVQICNCDKALCFRA